MEKTAFSPLTREKSGDATRSIKQATRTDRQTGTTAPERYGLL
jgi:hypothetical protein